jgi:DNA-binding transcriptional ArsR family regulator
MSDLQAAARIGWALSDPTRLRPLRALLAGDAAVTALAADLGLPQPRVSAHLAALRGLGLVAADTTGRQRTYRVDAVRIAPALAALDALAADRPAPSAQAAREVRRDSPLRQARTCYDHLAGVAGVALLDALLGRGWLAAQPTGARLRYQLTRAGSAALAARAVAVPSPGRRLPAYACLDWTERRPHLGGALGAALLRALVAADVVRRAPPGRAVILRRPLADWLG